MRCIDVLIDWGFEKPNHKRYVGEDMTKTNIEANIIREMKGLSLEMLGEILDFVQFLKTKHVQQPRRQRIFGSAKGLIRIADDFDEPLDDFQEYM